MDNHNFAVFLFRAKYSMKFHRISYEVTPFLSQLFDWWINLVLSIRFHEHLRQFSVTLYIDWLCIPPFSRVAIENFLFRIGFVLSYLVSFVAGVCLHKMSNGVPVHGFVYLLSFYRSHGNEERV